MLHTLKLGLRDAVNANSIYSIVVQIMLDLSLACDCVHEHAASSELSGESAMQDWSASIVIFVIGATTCENLSVRLPSCDVSAGKMSWCTCVW